MRNAQCPRTRVNCWSGGLLSLQNDYSSSDFILNRLPEGNTTLDGFRPNNAGLAEKDAAMNTPTKTPKGVPVNILIVAVDSYEVSI